MARKHARVYLSIDGVRARRSVERDTAGRIRRLYPTDRLRRAVAQRAGVEPGDVDRPIPCDYCGLLGSATWPLRADGAPSRKPIFIGLALDHIYPYSKGGSTYSLLNLALACRRCNSSKGDRLLSAWLEIRGAA